MSFWGKIIGGAVGFAMGGPFGAVVGAGLGHAADEGALKGALPQGADVAALLGSRESLFAVSVVVLSAKLAKCDGPVRRAEIDAFKRNFRVPPENARPVGELFDRARDSAEGFEPYARRLGEAYADEPGMLEDVLGALFRIAEADGPPNRAELEFLGGVHRHFALEISAWERARGAHPRPGAAGGGAGYAPPEPPTLVADAYAVLGLTREAGDEAVRAAWRRLVRENHPDTVSARGGDAAAVARATTRVADINAAWDRIKRERAL